MKSEEQLRQVIILLALAVFLAGCCALPRGGAAQYTAAKSCPDGAGEEKLGSNTECDIKTFRSVDNER